MPQNCRAVDRSSSIRRTDPRGRVYFWNSPGTPEMTPDPDTDEFALAEGYITVTPLQFDLTDHRELGRDASVVWEVRPS